MRPRPAGTQRFDRAPVRAGSTGAAALRAPPLTHSTTPNRASSRHPSQGGSLSTVPLRDLATPPTPPVPFARDEGGVDSSSRWLPSRDLDAAVRVREGAAPVAAAPYTGPSRRNRRHVHVPPDDAFLELALVRRVECGPEERACPVLVVLLPLALDVAVGVRLPTRGACDRRCPWTICACVEPVHRVVLPLALEQVAHEAEHRSAAVACLCPRNARRRPTPSPGKRAVRPTVLTG